MQSIPPLFLALDLCGVLAFAVNGALTGVRLTRLDIVGVLTLAAFTVLGGGMVRDIILGDLPPASFMDWRYLTVAAVGGLIALAWRSPAGPALWAHRRPRRSRTQPLRGGRRGCLLHLRMVGVQFRLHAPRPRD